MASVRSVMTSGPPRTPSAPPAANAPPQLPAVSWGTVGHVPDEDDEVPDITAAYWFLRGGQAYVDCTVQPSGSRCVARVNMDGMYEPLSFGDRVILLHANGDMSSSMVLGKMHDDSDPMPATVAGMPTDGPVLDPTDKTRLAGRVQFVRPKPDCVLAIETTGTGDVVIHSGAGIELRAGASGWVVIGGQHVVLGDVVQIPPIPGQMVGEDETPAVPFIPPPGELGANPTDPPYEGFMDAVIRARDAYQSNAIIDPVFWIYLEALAVFVELIAATPPIAAVLAGPLAAFQAIPRPTALTANAMTASSRVEARG